MLYTLVPFSPTVSQRAGTDACTYHILPVVTQVTIL